MTCNITVTIEITDELLERLMMGQNITLSVVPEFRTEPPPPPPPSIPPENITAPVVSGTTQIGQTVTTTDGTWVGSGLTITYQWLADGFTIPGATNNEYILTENERSKKISCQVSAENTIGIASVDGNTLVDRVIGASAVTKRYIRRTASGSANGTDWANAGPLTSLNTFISDVGANGEVLIRADEGTYSASTIILSAAGPTDSNGIKHPVIIRGCDVNEDSMNAVIVGSRSSPWISNGTNTTGPEVFRLGAGVGNLKFRNIEFQRCGNGCFRIADNVDNLTIEQCNAVNVQRFIENTVTGVAVEANLTNSRIGHCEVRGFSRAFSRLRYDGSNLSIHDCFGDSEFQDGDDFAAGVVFTDTFHDVIIERCEMRNCLDTQGGDGLVYWNADGFSQETPNFGFQYIDCIAKGCSDGGFDCKGEWTMLRCIAKENKKNFRLWGTGTATNCVSLDPIKRGGNSEGSGFSVHNPNSHIIINGGSNVSLRGTNTVMYRIDDITSTLTVSDQGLLKHANDGLLLNDEGATVILDTINTPICTINPVLSTADVEVGEVLEVSEGTWNIENVKISYQWCRNGFYIDDATESSYTTVPADLGQILTCRVYATSGSNNLIGEAISNASEAIAAVPPLNTVTPTISGLRVIGATLGAVVGTWTGVPTPTFTYQWKRNGVNISGATNSTYVLVTADLGTSISVAVTGTNSAGADIVESEGTELIDDEIANIFIAPVASGNKDGTSFDNALAITSMSSAINQLPVGGTCYLRADAGDYNTTSGIAINRGDITIRGVDVNLNPMKARIFGTRTAWTLPVNPEQVTSVSSWTVGSSGFLLNNGCNNVTFRDLYLSRMGNVFDADRAHLTNITLEDIELYNFRDGWFMNNFQTTGLTIRRLKSTGFSKRTIRLFNNTSQVLIEDIEMNSGRQDRDDFAGCIAINDTAHDIVIRGFIADSNGNNIGTYSGILENCHDTNGTNYWNADGISTERDNDNILIENVICRGHTDGGIDTKGTNVIMRNVHCYDNKKNFRLWGYTGMVMENCISENPFKRGGNSSTSHVFIVGAGTRTELLAPDLTVRNCVFNDDTAHAVWNISEDNEFNVLLREYGNTFNGGAINNGLVQNCLKISGTPGDTTPPTILTANSNVFNNKAYNTVLTANKDVSWRIVGGVDQAHFSLVDSGNVANPCATTLKLKKAYIPGGDNDYVVTIEAKDANSNINTKTLTITVLEALPPMTFHSTFEGANNQTTPITDLAGGKSITFSSGALLTTSGALSGTTSLLLAGGNDRSETANHTDFNITGEFSFEALIRASSIPQTGAIISKWSTSDDQRSWRFGITSTGALDFFWSTNGTQVSGTLRSAVGLIAPNTTYKVAVDRDELGNIRLYIDGAMVIKTTTPVTGAFFQSTTNVRIGNNIPLTESFVGRIDNLKYWKDYAYIASDAGEVIDEPTPFLVFDELRIGSTAGTGMTQILMLYRSSYTAPGDTDEDPPNPTFLRNSFADIKSNNPGVTRVCIDQEGWWDGSGSASVSGARIQYYLDLISIAHEFWPDVGIYSTLPERSTSWLTVGGQTAIDRKNAWIARNSALQVMWDAVDTIYPSLYYLNPTHDKWINGVEQTSSGVKRNQWYQDQMDLCNLLAPGKPVYWVIGIAYHISISSDEWAPGTDPDYRAVRGVYFRASLDKLYVMRDQGSAGIVLWQTAGQADPRTYQLGHAQDCWDEIIDFINANGIEEES